MFKVITCLLLALSQSLFPTDSPVVQLTAQDFKQKVLDSTEIWFVEFYAPWCGHCKNLAPEWMQAAKGLKGIVNIAAVDMTTQKEAGAAYGIKGFPTIKIFGENKKDPTDYKGGRNASAIMEEALNLVKIQAFKKAGLPLPNKEQQQNNGFKSNNSQGNSKVIVIDDSNYKEQLLNTEEPVFLEVYAPWCGHCKQLAPKFEQLPGMNPNVKIAKYDGDANKDLASQLGIRGFPTIFFFPAGKKTINGHTKYEGGRELNDMDQFLKANTDQTKPLVFEQLLSQEQFDKHCAELSACFIAFLPPIEESSAKERQTYISYVKDAATKTKLANVAYFWSQGGDQYEFEESLGMSSGYPSFVAISQKKKAYVVFRTSFTQQNIEDFSRSLLVGKQNLKPVAQFTKIQKATKWDGKDKPVNQDL